MRTFALRPARVLVGMFATVALSGASLLTTVPLVGGPAVAGATGGPIELSLLGRWISGDSGQDDASGAEIADFDPATKRLFVTNAGSQALDIVDASNPAAPSLFQRVSLGRPIQSVAVHGGLAAVVVEGVTRQSPGEVRVFDTAGVPQWTAETGALPDMVTFTPDGTKLVIANEGEPSTYCAGGSDPEGSISIVDVASHAVSTASFVPYNAQQAALEGAGVRIFGPNATVAQDLEPEYITVSSDSQTAWVTLQENNALAIVDIAAATVTSIEPLGYADHSSGSHPIDTSDRELPGNTRSISIVDRPIKGMYMPDSIGSYEANGQTYLVTANEGDAREYGCLLGGTGVEREDPRINSTGVGLDPAVFPNNEVSNTVLGRLRSTIFEPAVRNGSGQLQSVYSYGSRSFTIRDASGALVWDSGAEFEQRTAAAIPGQFNAEWATSGTVTQFDERSPAKGPEPEGLTVGSAYGKTFAFVGLERPGGIFAYDVSDPGAPSFVQYLNTSNFSGNYVTGAATAAAGDVAPEGLHFVPALDSPTGKPWVIASYELSGTVAIFELNGPPTADLGADTTVAEAAGSVSLDVTLSEDSTETVTVDYEAVAGTASAGDDFGPTSGQLTFTPSDTTETIVVPIVNDSVDDENETFSVELTGAANAVVGDGSATVTITDDDKPTISIGDASVIEGNRGLRNLEFTVSLSSPSNKRVTAFVGFDRGTALPLIDYIPLVQLVSLPAGTTTRTVKVPVVGDRRREPDETVLPKLLAIVGPVQHGDLRSVGTILNDD